MVTMCGFATMIFLLMDIAVAMSMVRCYRTMGQAFRPVFVNGSVMAVFTIIVFVKALNLSMLAVFKTPIRVLFVSLKN